MDDRRQAAPTDKLRTVLLDIAGWLIPLLASAPSLFIWAGLMTLPLVMYLALMFLSLFNPAIKFHGQPPAIPYFLSAIEVLLLGGPHLPDQLMSILGVFVVIYATVYLNRKRKGGLVTSGPYRLVRNPQYLGALLFIINLTSRSYREVLGDVGWLGPTGTLLVWFGTLVAYILLALVEEIHLSRLFGDKYDSYRDRTPFLIPFFKARRRWLEIAISVLVPAVLLWALAQLNRVLYP